MAVAGRYAVHPRYGPELAVRVAAARPSAHEYDLADLLDGPPRPVRADGGRRCAT